jgi:hypothetical protein
MYEYDVYADARQTLPRLREPLQAMDGEYYLVKTDILAHTMSFSSSKDTMSNLITIPTSRVREILAMNRAGKKVESLIDKDSIVKVEEPTFRTEEDSITRFDNQNKRRKNRNNKNNRQRNQANGENSGEQPSTEQGKEPREGKNFRNKEGRNDRSRNNHRDQRKAENNISEQKNAVAANPANEAQPQKSEGKEQGGQPRENRENRNNRNFKPRHNDRRRDGTNGKRANNGNDGDKAQHTTPRQEGANNPTPKSE